MLYGVDVASYEGRPDWRRVYGSGIRFAFSKVSESTNYVNPTWSHNRSGMLGLGGDFVPGAYHFLHGGNGAAQARYFLDKAGELSGVAVALDVEASGADAPTARAWVAEVKSRTGGHPVIGYFPRWYWEEHGRPDLGFFDTIWESRYVSGSGSPTALYRKVPASFWTPYGGEPISILQYSSSGSVPGITGHCDVNAFRGSVAELKALALGSHQEDEVPIRSSYGKSRTQALAWGKFTVLNWDVTHADPAGSHSEPDKDHPDGYPGYVAPLSTWADITAIVGVEGMGVGDEYQMRFEVHDWKDGQSAGVWTETRADALATSGAQYVTGAMPKGLSKGQHVYVAIAVFPSGGDPGTRPVPRATSGRWTIAQDRG
ncbi:glycoside hydrolase family 25 protein [Actinomadura luteofluorescens]|uniref:glycoside hydrolase family 25 protein n=1 Tax=Actinomadura luteofluorescens TaxID=46163 RepID=UPI0030D4AB94